LQPPVSLVSCGIDLRRFRVDASVDRLACRERYGLDPRRTIFLFVGRVEKDKRIDVLLHAAARLKRDDIQLVIAGHGGASEYYEALSRSLNLGGGSILLDSSQMKTYTSFSTALMFLPCPAMRSC